MSDEIQRYALRNHSDDFLAPCADGIWCYYAEADSVHLADKKAALEAQAEDHRGLVSNIRRADEARVRRLTDAHAAELAEKDEWHTRAVGEVQAYWLGKFSTLQEKHAAQIEAQRGEGEPASPDDIRALGWVVAIHNDYQILQRPHTFWLFTKDGRAVKGEGPTDAIALEQVRDVLQEVDNA